MTHTEQQEEAFSLKNYFVPFTSSKAIHFIVIIGILVFFNGLFNNFVGDDMPLIPGNPTIQSLKNLPEFFTESIFYAGEGYKLDGFVYRPLQTTTFSIIYSLFGPSPFVYHLFQLILCIINACILFIILNKYIQVFLSFLLSVIFLIHPINSEAVLYIASTQEVLFFFFGILSLWILQKNQSQKAFAWASFLLFLSLLSKETGILFFFVNILYILLFNRKKLFQWLGYSGLVFCLYLILRIFAIGFSSDSSVLAPIHDLDLQNRIINIPAIFLFYIKTLLFPLDLAMSYHWVITKIDFIHFFLPLILDLLFLASIFIFAIIIYKKFSRKMFLLFIFFALWFLLGVAIHIQIIPLELTVSERWFYFPIVGILGMTGVVLEVFKVNIHNRWFIVICVSILILLSLRTFARSFDWRNEFTIANHDSNVSKEAYNLELILSSAYFNERRYDDAVIHAQKSIQLYPNAVNYNTLGLVYFNLGNYEEAKKAYMKSLQFGEFDATYANLAVIALLYGDPHNNINFIKNTALVKYPHNWKLWFSLACLEYNYGNKKSGKDAIERAHKLDQGEQVTTVYNIIMTDKPLNLKMAGKH